jgi:hypothetical protein
MDINRLDHQVTAFVEMNGLPDGAFVPVTVDALAMRPDPSCLPGKTADYSFVISGKSLDR